MTKLIIILAIVLGFFVFGLCGYLSYQNNALGKEVARLREDLSNRDTLIAVQNKAIEQNALDLHTYKERLESSNTQIFTKYQNVYVKDTSCASELASIKALIGEFYN